MIIIDWLTSLFQTSRRLLPGSTASCAMGTIALDDLPMVWDQLAPVRERGTIAAQYQRVRHADAVRRLEQIATRVRHDVGDVRGLYIADAEASQSLNLPALPLGLIKLYAEAAPRLKAYAPLQRYRKDDRGMLWLALLLADAAPRATGPLLTPAEPVTMRANTGETIPQYRVRPLPTAPVATPPEFDLLSALVNRLPARVASVPEQQSYPLPVPVVTTPLPEADEPIGTGAPVVEVEAPPALSDEDWLADIAPDRAPRIAFSAIIHADNLAFIGPKGSGKTTALLTAAKYRSGEAVALDPHATPGKWPCPTVGNGRDFDRIRLALIKLHSVMNARFRSLGDGTQTEAYWQARRQTMISDEFRAIVKGVPPIKATKERGTVVEEAQPGAGEYLLERISEGRKVGQCVMVAAHNDTLEALGLPSGTADMKTCFDFFIYCGGLAIERYGSRGRAPTRYVDELRAMERPYVVWDTERNTWALLDFDCAPVLLSEAAPVEVIPTRPIIAEPRPKADGATILRTLATKLNLTLPVGGSVKERTQFLRDQHVQRMLYTAALHTPITATEATSILVAPSNGDLRTEVGRILDKARQHHTGAMQ